MFDIFLLRGLRATHRCNSGVRPTGRHGGIWSDYDKPWELPVIGAVETPTAVLVRPDGYVAWVGQPTKHTSTGVLTEALTAWFGPPAAAS